MWYLKSVLYLHSLYANGLVVQLVRIHACHAWGRGFESRPDRKIVRESSKNLGLFSALKISCVVLANQVFVNGLVVNRWKASQNVIVTHRDAFFC